MAPGWRWFVSATAAGCAVLVVVLGAIVHRHRTTRFDTRALSWLYLHVTGGWVRVTIDAATPAVSIVVLAVVLVLALRARRYPLAAVTVLAPTVSSCVTEFVLKTWVARPYGMTISSAYPSGHETLVASTALVVVVATGQVAGHRIGRGLVVLVVTVWTAGAGVGLIVNFWHYTTDVIGAIALSVVVVAVVALACDLTLERFRRARPGDG